MPFVQGEEGKGSARSMLRIMVQVTVTRSNFCLIMSELVGTKPLPHSWVRQPVVFEPLFGGWHFLLRAMLFAGTLKENKSHIHGSHSENAFLSAKYFHTQCQIRSQPQPCTSYYSQVANAESLKDVKWFAPRPAASHGRAPCRNPDILTPNSRFTLLLPGDTVPTVKELRVMCNALSKKASSGRFF